MVREVVIETGRVKTACNLGVLRGRLVLVQFLKTDLPHCLPSPRSIVSFRAFMPFSLPSCYGT